MATRAAYMLPARRRHTDAAFRAGVRSSAAIIVAVLVAMVVFLVIQAWPSLQHYGFFGALTSSRWAPSEATPAGTTISYGVLQFVYGTVVTSAIAMLIAVPAAIAIALYVTDFAPRPLRRPLSALIDLLAAVPSVIYGFWGIFAFIPAIRPVAVWLTGTLGGIPVIGKVFAGPFFGPSYVAAALVLALMVLPIVTAVCREVFRAVPRSEREAAYALGATRWEMVRIAVLPRARSGIVGAGILGLGRAIGETIAVTMLIGNSVLAISTSIFGQGATMASVIANEFTEATEPFHLESLFVVAFWLLIIAVAVNAVARRIVNRAEAAL